MFSKKHSQQKQNHFVRGGVTKKARPIKKIAFFAPSLERIEHIKSLLADHVDEVLFVVAHLSGAIVKARELERQGVEIIIARGETASVIRDAVPEIIVVTVPITGVDLVLALEEARAYSTTVAAVTFSSMIPRIEELARPLSMRILKFVLPRLPPQRIVEKVVAEAAASGAGAILGGISAILAAKKMNLPNVFIPAGDEAYVESFQNARSILQSIEIQEMESKIRTDLQVQGHVPRYDFSMIHAEDKRTRDLLQKAKSIAAADSNVIILGETGTGKEMFAQSIHRASKRGAGPFVAVNCGALPASLLESELFGYVGGAFTGARREGKRGYFEIAHTGTLFLDEIGEMDIVLQSNLLRVLQERAIMRLGGDRLIPVNIRVIVATHRDLRLLIDEGRFRRDLYYRLNVLNLFLPPLRERRRDIPGCARAFLAEFSGAMGKKISLSSGALRHLERLDWLGNIRELRNMMERIAAVSTSGTVGLAQLKPLLDDSPPSIDGAGAPTKRSQEERELRNALKMAGGGVSRAAEILGVTRVTLWRRMGKYGVNRRDYQT